jgi:hypothetical protein
MVLCEFNDGSPKSYVTFKLKHNNKLNFLDTTHTKYNNSLQTLVHRKCITYSCNIPNDSIHPAENKQVGIRYLIKWTITPYKKIKEYKELKITQDIVHYNQFQNEISNAIQSKILIPKGEQNNEIIWKRKSG